MNTQRFYLGVFFLLLSLVSACSENGTPESAKSIDYAIDTKYAVSRITETANGVTVATDIMGNAHSILPQSATKITKRVLPDAAGDIDSRGNQVIIAAYITEGTRGDTAAVMYEVSSNGTLSFKFAIRVPELGQYQAKYMPNGDIVIAGEKNTNIRLYDGNGGLKKIIPVNESRGIDLLAIQKSSGLIVYVPHFSKEVKVVDINGSLLHSFTTTDYVWAVSCADDGLICAGQTNYDDPRRTFVHFEDFNNKSSLGESSFDDVNSVEAYQSMIVVTYYDGFTVLKRNGDKIMKVHDEAMPAKAVNSVRISRYFQKIYFGTGGGIYIVDSARFMGVQKTLSPNSSL